MLDLRLIRQEPDAVRAALARRGPAAVAGLDRVIELDERRRAAIPALEALRASRNAAAEAIAQAKRGGGDAAAAIAEQRELGAREKDLAQQLAAVEEELNAALAPLPNLPDPTAAPGPEDELVRVVGDPPALSFPARDHLELAGALIDMDRAANLSGSRFAYLKGDLVMLELALVRWALEKLRGHGFEPVIPPVLVRERALFGTGFLPDTEQQIYSLPADELYLVGTSEVALASLHDGEILDAERLPLRYAGFSPCFRREAGAAGRDTRGIFRVHQFDKVEMFSFVEPARSAEEHERILAIEEEVLRRARPALPRRQHRRRRSRQLGRQEVRLRGLAAESGALPRADLVLEHHRLPGPAPGDPRAPREGRPRRRDPAHAQRHRRRRRAHADRAARERPARGRQRRAARLPARVRGAGRAARRGLAELSSSAARGASAAPRVPLAGRASAAPRGGCCAAQTGAYPITSACAAVAPAS